MKKQKQNEADEANRTKQIKRNRSNLPEDITNQAERLKGKHTSK
jgi:hypothetical protein